MPMAHNLDDLPSGLALADMELWGDIFNPGTGEWETYKTTAQQVANLGGGGGGFQLYDPRTYGCVGDGSTDSTVAWAAMSTAIDMSGLPAAIVIWPGLDFKMSVAALPSVVPVQIFGYGSADELGANGTSILSCSSATADFLDFTVPGSSVDKLLIRNVAGGTPSAGSGMKWTAGGGSRQTNLYVDNFWIGIDHVNSREWYLDNVCINAPVKYGMRINNVAIPDGGDCSISNLQVIAETHNADAAIRIESGGGIKMVNVKGNVRSGGFVNGIDLAVAAAVNTSLLQIANSSFENMSGSPIKGRVNASGSWSQVTLTGVQMNTSGNVPCVDLDGDHAGGLDCVVITGCILRGTNGATTAKPVKVRNVERLEVGANMEFGNYGQGKLDVSGITYLHNLDRIGNSILTLTAGHVAIPLENFDNHQVTLTTNAQLDNPTTPSGGQSGVIRCIQDATGGRVITLGSKFKLSSASAAPVTAGNTTNSLAYEWDGNTDTYVCAWVPG